MNIEDDLRSRRGPLQVSTHPNPQFVDVSMLSIIRRNRQRVRDGQQLGEEGKRVRSLSCTAKAVHLAGLTETCNCSPPKTARHQVTSPAELGAEEGLSPGI